MFTRLILVAALAASSSVLGTMPANRSIEDGIAKIDAATADPARKMAVLEAMAVRLGTHRNRLLYLRRQTGESFGRIFVSQLEERGKTPDQTAAELQAVNNQITQPSHPPGETQGAGSPATRPVLFLGAGVDHSSPGTFITLAPEVGLDSRRFTLVGGVPYFRNSGSGSSVSGVGDAYVSGLVRGKAGRLDVGANLVIGFPTGDEEQGLGAGKVTVDASGLLQRRFERFRPFVKVGVANFVFNNVGYQRPYISTGNAVHLSGGLDFRAHDRVALGAGGFAVWPWGDQTVQPRMPLRAAGRQSSDTTGMGSGLGGGIPQQRLGNMPFLSASQQTTVPAGELQDHGAAAWASFELRPGVTLNFSVARSFPFELTTAGLGLGLDFARLFFPGF